MMEGESYIVRQLPNGELYRVKVDKESFPDDMLKAQRAQKHVPTNQVVGENRCTHCGGVFTSPSVLSDHVKMFHSAVGGVADMRPVPLPDGSAVPAAAVKQELDKIAEE